MWESILFKRLLFHNSDGSLVHLEVFQLGAFLLQPPQGGLIQYPAHYLLFKLLVKVLLSLSGKTCTNGSRPRHPFRTSTLSKHVSRSTLRHLFTIPFIASSPDVCRVQEGQSCPKLMTKTFPHQEADSCHVFFVFPVPLREMKSHKHISQIKITRKC